jgi:NAD-dependent dihydropyrimidine dehydrogenase PreA subunit
MIRKIITINEDLCNGCGLCVNKCAESALKIVDGKARLVSEVYCDGLGACIGDCPLGAFTIEERDARPFDEQAPLNKMESQLTTWPVQLNLVPVNAPFLKGADILICADCVPFALPDFHQRFLRDRIVLVGCPKLDDISYYREKLRDFFLSAEPSSITVLRMEVPCCGGIARAAVSARDETALDLPVEINTVGIRGDVIRETIPPVSRSKAESKF